MFKHIWSSFQGNIWWW